MMNVDDMPCVPMRCRSIRSVEHAQRSHVCGAERLMEHLASTRALFAVAASRVHGHRHTRASNLRAVAGSPQLSGWYMDRLCTRKAAQGCARPRARPRARPPRGDSRILGGGSTWFTFA
eukprot:6428875-Prymnesium_polylepis.1